MLRDENELVGAAGGQYLVGVSNVDPPGPLIESDIKFPVPNEAANWVYYDITLSCYLDSGIVIHRTLPQVDRTPDTLAACDPYAAGAGALTGKGVNLRSNDMFQDTVQRMAHSIYWFRLWGQALRVGEQIPIPGLRTIAGIAAVPYDSEDAQFAFNKNVGNYSGLTLWHAQWSLWYTLANAPKRSQKAPPNFAAIISGDTATPDGMQAPWSIQDDNAQPAGPPRLR